MKGIFANGGLVLTRARPCQRSKENGARDNNDNDCYYCLPNSRHALRLGWPTIDGVDQSCAPIRVAAALLPSLSLDAHAILVSWLQSPAHRLAVTCYRYSVFSNFLHIAEGRMLTAFVRKRARSLRSPSRRWLRCSKRGRPPRLLHRVEHEEQREDVLAAAVRTREARRGDILTPSRWSKKPAMRVITMMRHLS